MKAPIVIAGFGASSMRGWRPGVHNYQTFRARFEQDLCEMGIPAVITDAGQPGNTVIGGHQRFERDVLTPRPHAVLIMFGLNDSAVPEGGSAPRCPLETYRAIHLNWLETLKTAHIPAVLLTPQNVVAADAPVRNARLRPYLDVLHELSRETGTPLINLNAALEKARRDGVNVEEFYLDGIHFNAKGNRFAADVCVAFEKETGFFGRL